MRRRGPGTRRLTPAASDLRGGLRRTPRALSLRPSMGKAESRLRQAGAARCGRHRSERLPRTRPRSAGPRAAVAGESHGRPRSEEHTSELQSRENLVCRLLLEKKKKKETSFDIFKIKKQ